MFSVAITGGIGSGKSYIAQMWSKNNIPVFNADKEAKKYYFQNDVKQKLITFFGAAILDGNQEIEFKKLASTVFSNKKDIDVISSIIHPLVLNEFNEWKSKQNSKIVVMESAIIFEYNLYQYFDLTILVEAPLNIRIKRIKDRDHLMSEDEIYNRIEIQMSDINKRKYADIVITNDINNSESIKYTSLIK